jgi:putative FmdB family regulatory protein
MHGQGMMLRAHCASATGNSRVSCHREGHPLLSAPFTMPTYEYVCEKCDHQFEVSQPMKDNALTICPQDKCRLKKWGKGKVKKLIGSGAGLIFKGSGFYITDYRSESYKEAAKKDAPPAAESGAKSDKPAKTEAAPKAESKPKPESKPKSDKS